MTSSKTPQQSFNLLMVINNSLNQIVDNKHNLDTINNQEFIKAAEVGMFKGREEVILMPQNNKNKILNQEME